MLEPFKSMKGRVGLEGDDIYMLAIVRADNVLCRSMFPRCQDQQQSV